MRMIVSFALLCLISVAASAQTMPTPSEGWSVSAGAGAILSPQYLGDDSYGVSAVPFIRVTHSDKFFASVQEGAGYNLINNDNFRAGPLATLAFGRDEDGSGTFKVSGDDTNDLLGLGDIDTSLSLGGFAEYDMGPLTTYARAGQAISGHDGLTGQIGVNYNGVMRGNGPPIIYTFGPSLSFGDNKYMDAFFGVDAVQSQASGLTPYNPDGGVVSYGVSGTVIVPLSRKLFVGVVGNYNRLTSDAADSSLVNERGSPDQAFLGLVVAYTIK